MNHAEKVSYITKMLNYELEKSELGAADYRQLIRHCYRMGIPETELEQYIAVRAARGELKQQQAGRSYYIVLTP